MADNGGYAFPMPGGPVNGNGDPVPLPEWGMTMRDYLAAAAMAAIISKHKPLAPTTPDGPEWDVVRLTAIGAYAYADAMLKERSN